MAKRKKTGKLELSDTAPTNNPFAAALAGMSAPQADVDDIVEPPTATKKTKFRVTTQIERKGRGGKTVTIVHGLETLGADEREDIARSLKKAMGTGVSVEGGTLVVQGELGDRIRTWFAEGEA